MDWFEILKAARGIPPNKDSELIFTVKDLSAAVGFSKTKSGCSPDQVASAWICKFVKWGYAEKVGTIPNPGHKPITTYTLTKEGREVKQRLSEVGQQLADVQKELSETDKQISDFDDLREAVRVFEAARITRRTSMGKKGEPKAIQDEEKAFAELLALCDRLDREEYGVE